MKYVQVCMALLLAVSLGMSEETLHRAGGLLFEDLSKVPFISEDRSVIDGGSSYVPLGRVDLSSQMPPVGNQGAQGSCVAWSVGYYHKGHTEWVERQWDQTKTTNQMSPAFMYNLINGGQDAGAYFSDAANLLVNIGLATMADMPYNQYNYTNWPSEAAWTNAIPFRGAAAYYINCSDTNGLKQVKARLDVGYTLVLGINVYSNFDYINNFDTVYCVADIYGTNRGGHGVTIVGYDDSKVTRDGVGAFRLVNSWGTSWGNKGYWWMSYQAVMNPTLSHRQALYITDRIGYQPTLVGKVRVTHPARERVQIRLGVGRSVSPLWQKDFLPRVTPSVDYAFPDNNIVLDMTEGASYIANGSTDSVFVRCLDNKSDGKTGTITYFAAEYKPWAVTGVSFETPVAIPDYNVAVFARARLAAGNDVGVVSIAAPAGTVDLGAVVTPSCEVKNYGTSSATFPVRMKIGSDYNQVVTVTNLAAGATQTVSFPAWTAGATGTYAVVCSTELTGDVNPGNDKATGSVTVVTQIVDAGAVRIVAPTGTVNLGAVVTPSCEVRNYGTSSATFPVRMKIGSDYNQVVTVTNLAAGATQTVSFPTWTAGATGAYAVVCSTELAGDVNLTNDKATGTVTVTATDVACTKIVAPTGTVKQKVGVTPACSLFNYGSTTVTYKVRMKIGTSYNKTATVTHAPGTAVYVTFAKWTASTLGTFTVTCSTELAGDMVPANDKATGSVVVTKTGTANPISREISTAYVDVSPNPVVGTGTVSYGLAREAHVELRLYDAAGMPRATLAEGLQPAGRYICQLRSAERGLASGVYFLRFNYGAGEITRKVLIE